MVILLIVFAVRLLACPATRETIKSSRLLRMADDTMESIRDRVQTLLGIMIDEANAFNVKGRDNTLRLNRPIDAVDVPQNFEAAQSLFRETESRVATKWRESLANGTEAEFQAHLESAICRALIWWAENSVKKAAETLHLWSRDKVKADEAVQNATSAIYLLQNSPNTLNGKLEGVAYCVKLAFAYWSLAVENILRRKSELVEALDED